MATHPLWMYLEDLDLKIIKFKYDFNEFVFLINLTPKFSFYTFGDYCRTVEITL